MPDVNPALWKKMYRYEGFQWDPEKSGPRFTGTTGKWLFYNNFVSNI